MINKPTHNSLENDLDKNFLWYGNGTSTFQKPENSRFLEFCIGFLRSSVLFCMPMLLTNLDFLHDNVLLGSDEDNENGTPGDPKRFASS